MNTVKMQPDWLSRVAQPDALEDGPCWEWPGSRQPRGYGTVAPTVAVIPSLLAHRNAYTIAYGAIPDGMLVCHHCDNPPCYRPSHLFTGDSTANMRDMAAKGRTGIAIGAAHGRAVFSDQDVLDVIALRADGWTYPQIAAKYGCHKCTVQRLIRGDSGYVTQGLIELAEKANHEALRKIGYLLRKKGGRPCVRYPN